MSLEQTTNERTFSSGGRRGRDSARDSAHPIMRILVIDPSGNSFPWMMDCISAGHDVRWYATWGNRYAEGRHPVKIVDDWKAWMNWAKEGLVFLSDNDHYLPELDRYRRMGWCICGATAASAHLEVDREAGMQILEKYGLSVPPYEMFNSLKEALQYALKRGGQEGMVFKTLGSVTDKSLTFVANCPAQMADRIDMWMAQGKKFNGKCMIQERIDGIEVAVAGCVGPGGWVGPWEENFEHKKLMSGNFGPNTGEMGTVIRYEEDSKLAQEILVPLTDYLKGTGHTSWVDLNCIITPKGKINPLEFTNRPGWPAFTITRQLHRGDPAQWMYDMAKGETPDVKYSSDVVVGLCVCQPDFPYTSASQRSTAGYTIHGLTDETLEWCHPWEVTIDTGYYQDGDKVKRGNVFKTVSEFVAVVCGTGPTITAAREQAYKRVKEIYIPNMIVRDDVGEKPIEGLPTLHKLGYLKGFKP